MASIWWDIAETAQHQMRNKLGIIRGTIEIIRHAETLSADGLDDIDRARRACDDLLRLVDGMSVNRPPADETSAQG